MITTANTRATLGEQATLDALVSHSLTEFEESDVTRLRDFAFYNQTTLQTIRLPGLTSIGAQAFSGCTALESLVLGSNIPTLGTNANEFAGTKIISDSGCVYVPDSALENYLTSDYWKPYNIMPVSAYPASTFDTTSETWEQIESNGGANLRIGDRKSVAFGSVSYIAVLVGKKKDTLTAGGLANTTWILLKHFGEHRFNSTATTEGGYSGSALRTYIINDVLSTFELKDLVKEVVKISDTYESGAVVKNGQASNEKLWIPSAYEMFGGTSYETEGCTYSDFFASSNARKKIYNDNMYFYWLRSAFSSTNFCFVGSSGQMESYNAAGSGGVVFGFCL